MSWMSSTLGFFSFFSPPTLTGAFSFCEKSASKPSVSNSMSSSMFSHMVPMTFCGRRTGQCNTFIFLVGWITFLGFSCCWYPGARGAPGAAGGPGAPGGPGGPGVE